MTGPSPVLPARIGWRVWTAVAIGGFLGTEARYLLSVLFPESADTVPWTTLAVNVLGSFVLGWLTSLWAGGAKVPRWLQAGAGPGLLGSFTTFSAVSLAVSVTPALFVPYLGLSLVIGVAAAASGILLGQRRAA